MPNLSVTVERTKVYVLCTRTSRDVTQWTGERSQGGQVRLVLRKLQGLYTCCTIYLLSFLGASKSKR